MFSSSTAYCTASGTSPITLPCPSVDALFCSAITQAQLPLSLSCFVWGVASVIQQRQLVSASMVETDTENVWVFGFGSLIHKAGFDYAERLEGYIKGYKCDLQVQDMPGFVPRGAGLTYVFATGPSGTKAQQTIEGSQGLPGEWSPSFQLRPDVKVSSCSF